MKQLLLSLLLFIQPVLANETDSLYEIQIGGGSLKLPSPQGMLRITPEMGDAYLFFKRVNEQNSDNYYYANYIDFEALQQGKERYCVVSTPKEVMNRHLSRKEIQAIKDVISTQMSSLTQSKDFQKDAHNLQQKRIDANAETIGAQLMDFNIISVDPIFGDENSYFYLLKKSMTVKMLDERQTKYELSAGGMLGLQGKFLNITCVTSTDEKDELWVKTEVLDWKNQIQQANPTNFFDTTWQTFIELLKESWWFRTLFILLVFIVGKRIFVKKELP